jgi:methylthioribose-1-phosphate isomerase
VTLITDGMAGHFMQLGKITCVIVGTDRTAANGDVANKIGTYPLAVLAREHDVPFVVAAPTSTIDLATPTGAAITVEERSEDEVVRIGTERIAPDGVAAANRAFDVTPARFVTAIVTERGVLRPPYEDALRTASA